MIYPFVISGDIRVTVENVFIFIGSVMLASMMIKLIVIVMVFSIVPLIFCGAYFAHTELGITFDKNFSIDNTIDKISNYVDENYDEVGNIEFVKKSILREKDKLKDKTIEIKESLKEGYLEDINKGKVENIEFIEKSILREKDKLKDKAIEIKESLKEGYLEGINKDD